MTLRIETFPAGPIETNAYLVVDESTQDALIIDAPFDVTEELASKAGELGATIRLLYITHAHWDHVGDAAALKARTGAELVAHRLCQEVLEHPGTRESIMPVDVAPVTVDRFVEEGDIIQLGAHTFQVMHLPGHEPGHTALYSEADRVFLGGDVLFPNGHGRIDIPGASASDMTASLSRLAILPSDVVVYPGHGATTTIGAERWLQSYAKRGGRA